MNRSELSPIVAKFGGTSNATAESVKKVADIVMANPDRRFIVESAPGKLPEGSQKVTELLLSYSNFVGKDRLSEAEEKLEDEIVRRFEDIGRGLGVHTSVVGFLNDMRSGAQRFRGKTDIEDDKARKIRRSWFGSRGEWIMAQTFAQYIGGTFVDAVNLIKFDKEGNVTPLSYDLIKITLNSNRAYYVIPGFYGEDSDGNVRTFPRGGSDITGSHIAVGVNAGVYENWTDVDGVRSADPEIIFDAKAIREITYSEMRELGYRGADVLHRDALWPVARAGIPIHIRNTFNPKDKGTWIASERKARKDEMTLGIAGRSGFVSVQIAKEGMNATRGIGRRVLEVFENNDVSFEHDPTGLDNMSVILHKGQLDGKTPKIFSDLNTAINPDSIRIIDNLGLVCVVGQNIPDKATQVHDKMYGALKKANITVLAESYSGGNNIVIAVPDESLNDAIGILYKACIR